MKTDSLNRCDLNAIFVFWRECLGSFSMHVEQERIFVFFLLLTTKITRFEFVSVAFDEVIYKFFLVVYSAEQFVQSKKTLASNWSGRFTFFPPIMHRLIKIISLPLNKISKFHWYIFFPLNSQSYFLLTIEVLYDAGIFLWNTSSFFFANKKQFSFINSEWNAALQV